MGPIYYFFTIADIYKSIGDDTCISVLLALRAFMTFLGVFSRPKKGANQQ
jgi:hypothetical protein